MTYNYKDSGIEWLGKVPEHWTVRPLKRALNGRLEYGANEAAELEDETLPRYIRITDFDQNGKLRAETFRSLPKEVAAAYLLEEGDVLFARSGATVGKTFIFEDYGGEACFAGYLIRARTARHKLLPKFLYYYTQTPGYEEWKNFIFTQATIQNIGADKYQYLPVPLPPPEEQAAIAAYLDSACAKLDRVIAIKEEQLGRLGRQMAAVIHKAVTKAGKRVELVDSGLDWLGAVPAHWKMTRLAALGTFHKGRGIPKADLLDDPDGIPAILYGDIYTKYDYETSSFVNRVSESTAAKATAVVKDDLIMAGSGESFEEIGKCIHYTGDQRAVAGGDTMIFKTTKANPAFLGYLLNSPMAIYQKASNAKGDIVVHTYPSELRNIKFPLPPRDEQDAISEHLDHARKNLDRMIGVRGNEADTSLIRSQIATLKTYRRSLIHECVTGKKQVYVGGKKKAASAAPAQSSGAQGKATGGRRKTAVA